MTLNKIIQTEILIIGGGMVGLSIAYQILERKLAKKIYILDKENKLGKHSSGRNSGVLHAGLYYKPDTIKAKVCVNGAKRLKECVIKRNLPINNCGKVIIPQENFLDSKLDLLFERGIRNGAKVEIWNNKQLKKFMPEVSSSSGRAIWSPGTCVINPIKVIESLQSELISKGVRILTSNDNAYSWKVEPENKKLILIDGKTIKYKLVFNCAGLQADKVAHLFNIGKEYNLIPFKGLYWQLRKESRIQVKANIYPVPDLNMPFLGVHFTPSSDKIPNVYIGPTATPALGRENYNLMNSIEPLASIMNLSTLARQYILGKGGFRDYTHEQLLLFIFPLFLKSAKKLIPSIDYKDIEPSKKVGIRSQLFNKKSQRLEDDFLCLKGESSVHILNAISPAFTASFELADLILDNSKELLQ